MMKPLLSVTEKMKRDFTRAQQCSVRFAKELQIAQSGLPDKMKNWNAPLFAVVAGDDKLADTQGTRALLDEIDQSLLTYQHHEKNYHENFNEVNREDIFRDIQIWIDTQMSQAKDINRAV